MLITEFATHQKDSKSGRAERGEEEQQRAASMKEPNKFATKRHGVKVEYYGRSGGRIAKLILFGEKQHADPIEESLVKFLEEQVMAVTR